MVGEFASSFWEKIVVMIVDVAVFTCCFSRISRLKLYQDFISDILCLLLVRTPLKTNGKLKVS